MIILFHSSKTMKVRPREGQELRAPQLLATASPLADYVKSLSPHDLARSMQISSDLAHKTHEQYAAWSDEAKLQSCALDTFVGDMYSGLQVASFTSDDRIYADQHLRILSGLYGVIRPLDGIMPYRLEMAYKLPREPYRNLYNYWGQAIADTLPTKVPVVNVSSVEYTQTVTPYIDPGRVITPQFLTVSPNTAQPTFVVVHAKIARGAFAHWLITQRIESVEALSQFDELGYQYSAKLSAPHAPAFVASTFGGLGLSVRLT